MKQTAAVSPAVRVILKEHQMDGTILSKSELEIRTELKNFGLRNVDHLMGLIKVLKGHAKQAQESEFIFDFDACSLLIE